MLNAQLPHTVHNSRVFTAREHPHRYMVFQQEANAEAVLNIKSGEGLPLIGVINLTVGKDTVDICDNQGNGLGFFE